jgi:hypothetical protein
MVNQVPGPGSSDAQSAELAFQVSANLLQNGVPFQLSKFEEHSKSRYEVVLSLIIFPWEDTWITGPLPLCNLQLQICGAVHSEHVLVWRKSGSVSSFPTWCLNQCAKWTHLYSVDTKDTHCMIFQSFYLPLTVTPLFSICQLAIHQQFQVRAVYWVIARVS